MHTGEQKRVDLLDAHSFFLRGSTVTFRRICKRRISSGELRGYFQMRPYIDVGILIGGWLSVNSHIKMMVTKRRLVRWPMHGIRFAE
ncbi:hypothetical protein Gogos_021624 [Gossypium gossypioides]|uniref:Uncharacterized protein n=1 Tax=Gossypium gossypioides TaxID=34282 RepID=A0A7J9D003_GOSGO|nr:hypothetical protein [Gossypium gossypioides]